MARARDASRSATPDAPDDRFLRSRSRRAALGLLCLKIAALPILFDRTVDVPFTVPKALFSHASTYLLAAMLAALVIRFRASFPWRSPLHLAVLAYVVVILAATVFAEDRYLALFGAHERMLGLGTLLDCVVLYLAVTYLVRGAHDRVAIAVSFFGAATVVLTYEVVQLTGLDPLSWSGATHIRPPSTVGQPNSLAEYLVVVAAAAGAVVLFGRIPRRLTIGLLALCVSALLGAAFTQTRSVVLGVAGAELAVIALVWVRYRSAMARARYIAAAAGVGVAFAGMVLLSPLGSRVATTVDFEAPAGEAEALGPRVDAAADVRFALYRMSLRMLVERPVLGYGPDNFLAALPRHRSDSEPYEVQANANSSAHGWVAQVATSSGLLGLVTFTAIAVVAAWIALRRPDPAAAIGAVMMGAFLAQGLTTINEISTEWLFWGAAGLVAGSSVPRSAPVAATGDKRKRARPHAQVPDDPRLLVATAILVLAGAAVAASAWVALDASRAAHASGVARAAGRTAEAIAHATRATRADAGRPQYWHALGLAYIDAGRAGEAVAAFERAHRLAPYDVTYGSSHAKALLVLGQRSDVTATGRASEVAEALVRTDPNNPVAHVTHALVMHANNRLDQAVASVRRAVALDRISPWGQTALRDTYVTGIQVLSAARRQAEALALADLGLSRLPGPETQVPVRIERARALAAGGSFEDAIRELDTVLALQPRNSAALELRAQIQLARPK